MKNTSETATIDPTELFAQFDPALHFAEPLPVDQKTAPVLTTTNDFTEAPTWYTVLEQTVPADQSTFWQTIRRWTHEPQFVIPPIEKAAIVSTLTDSEHRLDDNGRIYAFETIVRELVPKRKSKDALLSEAVHYYEHDTEGSNYIGRVVYQPLTDIESSLPFYYPKVQAYSFTYTSAKKEGNNDDSCGVLRLQILPIHDDPILADPKMRQALQAILHKLFKWCIQARFGYKKKAHHDTLIPKDAYLNKYQELKSKYADLLVSSWTEKTDPKKFVYEDIAIASYLICLWTEEEQHTKRKPTFVDLGCGNGLLTFLMTREGYQGYGVDMASRKIWKRLCDKDNSLLKVQALYPATVTYQTDWIIGNHADELVPWIPIITTKSGKNCKFLVIPCCFYGLDGTRKLSLMNAEGGKYRAYTNYIKAIATQCGFQCEEDYLRIPSTKNIALIGRQRLESIDDKQLEQIQAPGIGFTLRKTDREKEELRRLDSKRTKIA